MITPDDILPAGLANRAVTTRYACELFMIGGVETNGKPCRSIPRLSAITGVAISTLRRSMDEDRWQDHALLFAIKQRLGSLAALPDHSKRVEKLNEKADRMLEDYLAIDENDHEASDIALARLERVLKLVGHDRRLGISAKIEERIRLDALKEYKKEEEEGGYGDGNRVLDVD